MWELVGPVCTVTRQICDTCGFFAACLHQVPRHAPCLPGCGDCFGIAPDEFEVKLSRFPTAGSQLELGCGVNRDRAATAIRVGTTFAEMRVVSVFFCAFAV